MLAFHRMICLDRSPTPCCFSCTPFRVLNPLFRPYMPDNMRATATKEIRWACRIRACPKGRSGILKCSTVLNLGRKGLEGCSHEAVCSGHQSSTMPDEYHGVEVACVEASAKTTVSWNVGHGPRQGPHRPDPLCRQKNMSPSKQLN